MEIREDIIGKEVYITNENNVLDKGNLYIVIAIKPCGECKDFCDHYVLKGKDGKEIEARSYKCVVAPNYNLPEEDMITKYISDNGLYAEDVYGIDGLIVIPISWGDWKHDHGCCDWLMGNIGYKCVGEKVTEENGSDCYSAIHIYEKR